MNRLKERERPAFDMPSNPNHRLLEEYAAQNAWKLVIREAKRSPMGGYGTGAVLLDKRGEILSNGCSSPMADGLMQTTHAERHCLKRANHLDLRGASCLIYTVSLKSGGCSWTSRPCLNCAQSLVRRGVSRAIYPVRDPETGVWRMEIDTLEGAIELWEASQTEGSRHFARNLSR